MSDDLHPDDYWHGLGERECGEHRTTRRRAWCFDCSEWCYVTLPCRGCELPALRAEVDRLAALLAAAGIDPSEGEGR